MFRIDKKYFDPVLLGLAILGLSLVTDQIFHGLGILVSFYFIWKAKIEYYVGLFLLYMVKENFILAIPPKEFFGSSGGLIVAGFPLNVATLGCLFITLRVFYEIICYPKTFENKVPRFLIYLWLISFVPTIIAFFWSYQLGHPNWTRGLRFLMISGSYFYGFIWAKNLKATNTKRFTKILFPFIALMMVLTSFNFFWSHLCFLFCGFAGSFSFHVYSRGSFFHKSLGLFLLILVVAFGISASLSTACIAVFSCGLSYLAHVSEARYLSRKIIDFASKYLIMFSITITIVISCFGSSFDNSSVILPGELAATLEEGLLTGDQILFKLIIDRLPFWTSAAQQIAEGPYFLVPSGRPFLVNSVYYGENFEWVVGAHNVYLETLRNTGLLVGPVIIFICLIAVRNNFRVLKHSRDRILKSLSIVVISVGLVGTTVGDFPIDMTVGFFLWSIAGFNYGSFLNAKTRKL
ncbi:hypothetical protein N8647_00285 [bacterium]|nr:hypothetical protein [bacterium]